MLSYKKPIIISILYRPMGHYPEVDFFAAKCIDESLSGGRLVKDYMNVHYPRKYKEIHDAMS